jgi:hypothetical protein
MIASPQRGQREFATAVGISMFAAVVGGLLWVMSRSERGQTPLSPSPSAEPTRVLLNTPPISPACVFPQYLPTYLPWLAPRKPIPAPDFRRLPGGGPQGLDPAYAILFWSHGNVTYAGGPRFKGNLTLWRTTEPPGAFPAHPDVPPLPGGSLGGRISRAPDSPLASGDWSITWADDPQSTIQHQDGCGETTLALSMPNLSSEDVRSELVRIAASLVPAQGSDALRGR